MQAEKRAGDCSSLVPERATTIIVKNYHSETALLLKKAINLVLVLELELLWCLIGCDTVTIEKEAERGNCHTLPVSVGIENFLHARRLLHLEEGRKGRGCDCNASQNASG